MSDSVTLMAVGDIMLGDNPACDGFGVGSMIERHGPLFPFQRCLEVLQSADILFGNLETVISDFERRKSKFEQTVFRGRPNSVEGLKTAGFDVLSLATNHIMQHGQSALDECLGLLAGSGISVTGIERPELHVHNLRHSIHRGLKLAFLGYNLRPQQYFLDPPCYVGGGADRILADIADARQDADFLVISVHWGDEFMDYPSPEQIHLAHRMIDAGGSLILGHHPHVIQGIERYQNGVIAYSLGNFVFDMWQKEVRQTMILKCELTPGGKINYEVIPVVINLQWQPEIMKGEAARKRSEDIRRLSNKVSVDTSDKRYRAELRSREKAYRRDVLRWYLAHLHRYQPGRLAANLGRVVRRRLFRSA